MTDRPGLRIDKWLCHSRLVKTRSLAARLCEQGQVMIGGQIILKPAALARSGDTVTLTHAGWHRTLEVLALGERRESAVLAAALYVESCAPVRITRVDPAWSPLVPEESEDGAAQRVCARPAP